MLKKSVEDYLQESSNIVTDQLVDDVVAVVDYLLFFHELDINGGNFFFCGNGGNVATVKNAVCDINLHPYVSEDKDKDTYPNQRRIVAHNLCSDPAVITGISNDFGFEHVFSKQLEVYSSLPNKVVVGISGSGTSKNIINAFKKGKKLGANTVLFTRNPDARDAADIAVVVGEGCSPSQFPGQMGKNNNNFHFEDYLSKVIHIFVGLLKKEVNESTK